MRFTKLRCVGFKSFVEPTEFHIEDGLTGIVGPNGCGKSNLVEALRWAMGESSYKNMRASGMDDVIFSGAADRPSRNTAEVMLFLDNSDRTAPAAFNDTDELQIARRIEREAGSAYRINGREVRAKDVQLLFADASTGARSPAMVGQGRVGELISAKPQARRALLEEAAGISGLHSRRHEAELRLRAADQNLERLEDILAQLDSQIDSLRRQARQASRYRNLSGDIRKAEALVLHLRWAAAKAAEADAASTLGEATSAVGARAGVQASAARLQAELASALPGLREGEARAAAALQRLNIARGQIEEEVQRLERRRDELGKRLADLDGDLDRERHLVQENAAMLSRLDEEEAALVLEAGDGEGRERVLAEEMEQAAQRVAAAEQEFGDLTGRLAGHAARAREIDRAIAEAGTRAQKLEAQRERNAEELVGTEREIAVSDGPERLRGHVDLLEKRAADAEADALREEAATEAARAEEQARRQPLGEAEAECNRIQAEIDTLARILETGESELFPAIVEQLEVEPGYETALGAAFGEDLERPADPSAAAYWKLVAALPDDAPLPDGVRSLASVVRAPPELARALAQTGIVEPRQGAALQASLKPGQRLVSRRGDLWRWDGYTAGADAPSAAAQKLAQKNRLAELAGIAARAAATREQAAAAHARAREHADRCAEAERATRENGRIVARELVDAREALLQAEREVARFASRRASLEQERERLDAEIEANADALATARRERAEQPDLDALESELAAQRTALAEARAALAEIRARNEGFRREAEARARRIEAIGRERGDWRQRAGNAQAHIATLEARRTETVAALDEIQGAPEAIDVRRRALMDQLEQAEKERRAHGDALAAAETRQAEADRAAREADRALSEAREARARAEERQAAAAERTVEIGARIREELDCDPADALAMAGLEPGAPLADLPGVEGRLERLRAERERLGAVNLRAEAEQAELVEQRGALAAERDDLVEAIKRLRQGIASLNREGRERLLEAFGLVNGHFGRLFTHLFGGGTAELQLVESDDPLEAGLEILARPPGKRPQTMTLLSGGEQALTALALIFAVFLTNPAPICVLDEVDAPLDDHNVERFCNLLDEMVTATQTRFVVITHNPITMARMNRLFGVTMAERGVSDIVSVTLDQAERLRDAG